MPESIEIEQEYIDSRYTKDWLESIQAASEVLLAAIIDVAALNDVEVPSRQLVYVGETPDDCEQVAVTIGTLGFGRPGDPMQGPDSCWGPERLSMVAEITRCVSNENKVRPVGRYAAGRVKLPTLDAMEDHASIIMKDMKILLEAARIAANYPHEGAGTEANVSITQAQSGYQSTILEIVMQV